MCIAKHVNSNKCKLINRGQLGRVVKATLTRAKVERRLTCGLLPAIRLLEANPDDVVLCVTSQTRPGDAATHIQTVLLQAFCFENGIPVIQVNSGEKLAQYCGASCKFGKSTECNCVIITRDSSVTLSENDDIQLSQSEQILTDFYECTLEEFPRPVIELPI